MMTIVFSTTLSIVVLLLLMTPETTNGFDFVGLWEGIDPLDGANMQRSFVLSSNNHDNNTVTNGTSTTTTMKRNFIVTGRIEFSQICGGDISGNISSEPDANIDSNGIPAVINGQGVVRTESSNNDTTAINGDFKDVVMDATFALTCFGEEEPRIPVIEVEYRPISDNLLQEIPAFRADTPIYLFRMSVDDTTSGEENEFEVGNDSGTMKPFGDLWTSSIMTSIFIMISSLLVFV